MKKLVTLCLTLIMVMAMSLTAFASNGGFVSSPSNNTDPQIISFDVESDDCEADLVITSYADRDKLPEDIQAKLEQAYNQIKSSLDLSKLCPALADLAKQLGISVEDLAVSDLFDIHYVDCGDHEGHGHFDITLKTESLEHFVALLHLKGDTWELVPGAAVTHDGDHLEFDIKDFSPFAVVVDTSGVANPPKTGDNSMIGLYAAIMAASAAALIFLWVKSRKRAE
ncbi:MAG: sortase B protein-sorting domain-containing protein [Lachnospiraceae bacterium]|nr:sortase B protein-sorting domain-containing protein [Lachnospiraceae bacterium]